MYMYSYISFLSQKIDRFIPKNVLSTCFRNTASDNYVYLSLMLGLMLPSWFLSMWISNTAAASMMVPIITALTSQMSELEPNKISRTVCCSLTYKSEMICIRVILTKIGSIWTEKGGLRNNRFDDVEDPVSNADTDVAMTNCNADMEHEAEPKDEKEKYEYTWICFLSYKFYLICILDKIYWIQLGSLVAYRYMYNCTVYENQHFMYSVA